MALSLTTAPKPPKPDPITTAFSCMPQPCVSTGRSLCLSPDLKPLQQLLSDDFQFGVLKKNRFVEERLRAGKDFVLNTLKGPP